MTTQESKTSVLYKEILFLVLIAFVIRWGVYFLTYTIKRDSIVFIGMARNVYSGEWGLFFDNIQHPLYPLFIAVTFAGIGDWVISGYFVSILFGSLSVIPVYFLSRGMFAKNEHTDKAAFFAALIMAVHPIFCRISASVLADSQFLCFYLWALWLGFEGLRREREILFFIAGFWGGFAYLTRPEGGSAMAIIGLWLVIYPLKAWHRYLGKRLISLALLGISFIIIAFPYILIISEQEGRWLISKKKQTILEPATKSGLEQVQYGCDRNFLDENTTYHTELFEQDVTFSDVFKSWIDSFHPAVFVLVCFGVWWTRRKIWNAGVCYILSYILFFGLLLFFLIYSQRYISKRHFLTIVSLCLCWSGFGVFGLAGLFKYLDKKKRIFSLLQSQKMPLCVLLVSLVILLPKTLSIQEEKAYPLKELGLWIKKELGPNNKIMSDDCRVAFYADGFHSKFPQRGGWSRLIQVLIEKNVNLLVARKETYFMTDKLIEKGHLVLCYEMKSPEFDEDDVLKVYKVVFK